MESFDDVFREEYMVEHRLVDIRLTEQLISGTINLKGSSSYNDPDPSIPAVYTYWQNNQMVIPAPLNDLSNLNSMYGCTDPGDTNYSANAIYNVADDCID